MSNSTKKHVCSPTQLTSKGVVFKKAFFKAVVAVMLLLVGNSYQFMKNFSQAFFTTKSKLTILFFLLIVASSMGQTTRYWNGTGTWTSSNTWGTATGGPYTTTWVSNDNAVFDVANSAVTFASTGVRSITANQNVTFTAVGTLTPAVVPMLVTVANGMLLNMAGQSISATATGNITKNGAGTLQLSNGNTYSGGFILNAGMVVLGGANALGSGGALTINGGTIAANATRDLSAKFAGGITIGGDFTFGSGTTPAVATSNLTFTNNVALGASTRTITIGGTGIYILGGVISGSAGSGLTIGSTAAGSVSLTGVNTYTGNTTISSGTLALTTGGSIAASPQISVGSGANFNISGRTAALTLAAGQSLSSSATGSNTTATVTVGTTPTLTLSAGGLAFTAYGGGATAPMTVAGAGGSLALASSPVTVTTSTALAAGTYKLIAKSGSATVTGTPGTLTMAGSGLAGGASGTLSIVSGELILTVASGCTAPSSQTSSLSANTTTTTTSNYAFTRGNGDNVLVVARLNATIAAAPASGTTYTPSATGSFTGTTTTGAGNIVVYNGAAAGASTATGNLSLTNLTAGSYYTLTAYEYATTGTCYNTTSPASGSFYTLSTAPSAHAASFTATAATPTSIDLSFSAASTIINASGYIVLQKLGASAPTGTPTNATGYSVGNTIGDGTVAAIVTSTATIAATISSLSSSTQYYYTIIPYNWDGANAATYNYYTSATIPSATATTASLNAPTITTPTAIVTSNTTATLGGNVTSDGGASVTARGVVWAETSLNSNPTVGGSNTTNVVGTGTTGIFTVGATVLPVATQISYAAYATNSQGTSYTSPVSTFYSLANPTSTLASSIVFGTITTSSIQLSWTNGDGANRIVVARLTSSTRVGPTNGVGYTANSADFTDQLNSLTGAANGNVVIFNGTGSTVTVAGLTTGTSYTFDIYEYNGSTVTANYGTNFSGAKSTMAAEPTVQATNVTFTNVSATGFKINWTLGNGATSIVLVKDVTAVDSDPVDGTTYTANAAFGSGTQIGTGNYVVYKATLATITVTGLTDGHTYHVAVYSFNGSGGLENYLTTSPATGSQFTSTAIFYSQSSSDPGVLTNWNTARGGGGTSPAAFTDGNFVIQNSHNMTTTAAWSVGATNTTLEIESGGTLTAPFAVTISSATGSTFKIDGGGSYIHNNATAFGTTIFNGIENFAATSNFEIQNYNTTGPSGITFGNLTINATVDPGGSMQCAGGITTVNGNFKLQNLAGVREIRLSATTTLNLVIGGDLIVQSGILDFASSAGTSASRSVSIGGNYNQTGGTVKCTGSSNPVTVTFTGSGKTFTQSAGTLTNTNINWAIADGASLTLINNLPVATSRTLTVGGGTSGILDCSNLAVSSTGSFTLSAGATLITANTLGLNGSITVSGTTSLNIAANYTFNGSLAQVTGLLLPATVNNLTISNTAGVTSSASIAVNGTMSVTGLFIPAAAHIISGTGTLNGSGTVRVTRTAATADFNTQYSISNKTLTSLTVDYSATSAQTINIYTYNNLTISGTGTNSKIAGGDITVNGILTLSSSNASTTQGALDMNTYTLNMGTTATTTGTGDVTGIVKRTSFVANTSYSFGNSNTTLQITSGSTLPSSISVTTILSSTNLSWNSLAIRRYYDLAQSGGSSDCKVTFRAHYLEAPELNSNTETSLDFYDHHVGGSGHDHGHSNSDATNNWVELANLGLTYLAPSTGFGVKYWTLSNSTMANFTWLGVDATGWETQENWVGNTVPIASSNVVIPTSSAYTYEATLPTTTINSITIAAGAVLNGGSSTLTLTQSATSSGSTWENDGTFIAGTGNVIFANTGNPQTIAGGSATVFNDLTINGSNTVTLGRNTTVGGTLTFTSGNLAIGSNTLTLNGSLVNTSGTLTGSSTSNLTIGGTGLNQALNFTSGARSLNNLTLSTSAATATLGTALDVYGNIQLNDGTLALGGLNLTLKSNTTNTASIDKLNAGGSNLTGGTNVTVERFIKLRATVNGTGTGNGGRAYRALASTVTTGTSINANWQEGLTNTIAGTNLVPASPYQNFGVQITGVGGSGSGFDVTQNNQASLYTFTNGSDIAGSTGYPAVDNTNTNTLNALTGYFLYIRGDRNTSMQIPYNPAGGMPTSSTTLRATGTVQTGNKILPISGTSGHVSMITNPYPAPLDWQAIYSGNSTIITSSYTRWDSNNGTEGGFVTVDQSGFPYTEAVGRYIQPGEAFFVHSIGAGSEVLITEAMKAVGFSTNVIYRPTTSFESFSTELYLTEANAIRHSADGLLVKYHNNYSAAVDADDADEMNNWNENIAISRSAHHLAIEARPVIVSRDTIPLLMNGLRQTNYEWVFTPSMFSNTALKAELVDRFLNTRTLLSVTDSVVVPFTVTANAASADTNRFMVVFSPLVPLAIDGLSISAQAKTNGVLVNWSAQKETAMDRYELERSFTGSDFIKINTTAAIGNSAVAVNYNWLDGRPQAGINFYRIRAVDKAGQVKYTNVVKVNTGRSTPSLTVVPNPITGNTINLQLSDVDKSHYTLLLYNNLGQQVLMTGFDHGGGSVTKSIAAGNALSNGIYRVVLMNETGTSITTTLIKN